MFRRIALCLILAASMCTTVAPLHAEPEGFISINYSLAAPMKANAIGFQMGSGWMWGGMHYASEGDSRDMLYMAQAGLHRGFGDKVTVMGGLSMGIQRNCVEGAEVDIVGRDESLSRPCTNANLTSADAVGGVIGYNLGVAYRLTEKLGALFMYDQFDNKPVGTDGLQGLLQFGLGYYPDWL